MKIGTLKESSLHRSLKTRYSDSEIETQIGDYVCDGKRSDGELIEVQTGSFGPLKEKVKSLCKKNKVRIIHPIIIQKTIELFDTEGRLLRKRKSPKKGCAFDLFKALVYAPELPLTKNLSIELAHIDVIEKRIDDGTGSWRRKGVRISDRFLGSWHHSVLLKSTKDYLKFIPFRKNRCFTAKDFGSEAGIGPDLARKTLYVLVKMGLVEKTGKQGRAIIYKKSKTNNTSNF